MRLNDEVVVVLRGRTRRASVDLGEEIPEQDIDDIDAILLTDKDPNAGHLTLIAHKGRWLLSFDFRRNAARIAETISAAREFLSAAELALAKGYQRPFCDLLFAASELTAKAELLELPGRELLKSRRHSLIGARYNKWGKLGNTSPEYVSLLNRLTKLRESARYLQRDFNLSDEDAQNMLQTARDALQRVESSAPTRFPTSKIREAALERLQSSKDAQS